MSRRDIAARFDDIVAFAELEEFIDEQVKHYSSGMYVRLGFAVAINVEPDVLLVDEVLSVGDEAFQQKCLERVRGFQRDGRTIIFVSHAADLVRRICNRVMVLDHGNTVTIDDPASAILVFRERLMGERLGDDRVLSHGHRITRTVRLTEVKIAWPGSAERKSVSPGEPVTVAVRYECDAPTADISFALAVRDTADTMVYGCNSDVLGQPMDPIEGTGWVTFEIPALTLVDGTYLIDVGAHTRDVVTEYDFVPEAGRLTVVGGGGVVGIADLSAKLHTGHPAD
jgi:ABC-2 type transport system ATP-binding protein